MEVNPTLADALRTGAREVLTHAMSWEEAMDAWRLILAREAVAQCDGVIGRAARKLGLTHPGLIYVLDDRPKKKRGPESKRKVPTQ